MIRNKDIYNLIYGQGIGYWRTGPKEGISVFTRKGKIVGEIAFSNGGYSVKKI